MPALTQEQLAMKKRMRGAVLLCVYNNHNAQSPRMDAQAVWAFLQDLAFQGIGKNETNTIIQYLCDASYLRCKSVLDEVNGGYRLIQIEITQKGHDLVEGTITDPAIRV